MDRGLKKLMRINRGRFFKTSINSPIIPPYVPPIPPTGVVYTASDFGENVINNHFYRDGAHSEKCQTIFNYITKDFRNRCTSHQTYNSTIIPSFLITLYRKRNDIGAYLYMVAISLDELGGCLIYGEKDKTVSYMTGYYILQGNVYAKVLGFVIDALFGENHCVKEYLLVK